MWKVLLVLLGIIIGVVACFGYHRAVEDHPDASWHQACFEADHVLPGCTGLPGAADQPPAVKVTDPEPEPAPNSKKECPQEHLKCVKVPLRKAEPRPAYCAYRAIRTNPTCPSIQWIRAHQHREAILVNKP